MHPDGFSLASFFLILASQYAADSINITFLRPKSETASFGPVLAERGTTKRYWYFNPRLLGNPSAPGFAAVSSRATTQATAIISKQPHSLDRVCGTTPLLWQKIIGGGPAEFGEFPWLASLRRDDGDVSVHKCGATLVHPDWVITAAHCAFRIRKSRMIVRLGGNDFNHPDEMYPYREVGVKSIRIHPDFDGVTFQNDLALLRLKETIRLMPNIVPICIAPLRQYVGSYALVTGWGLTNPVNATGSSIVQKLFLPIINTTVCEQWYDRAGRHQVIETEFLCAGYKQGGRDTCQGDSGGPLIQEIEGRWALVGVISWGLGCARPNLPGVSTFIPIYQEWLRNMTQGDVHLPSFYEKTNKNITG